MEYENMNKQRFYWHLGTVIIGVLIISACSSQFNETLRKVTYPPDFKYTKTADLRSEMGKLAQQMLLLDKALINVYEAQQDGAENRRQQVLLALKNMGKTAANLKEGETGGNHPFIQQHLQEFVAKIDHAKTAASLPEPNYYFAGKVSGGCTNCHKVNR